MAMCVVLTTLLTAFTVMGSAKGLTNQVSDGGQSEEACLLQSAFTPSDLSVNSAGSVHAEDEDSFAPVTPLYTADEATFGELPSTALLFKSDAIEESITQNLMLRSRSRSQSCKAHLTYLDRKVNGLDHSFDISDKKIDELIKGFISKQSGSEDACSSQLMEAKHQLNQIHEYVSDLVVQVNHTERAILALDAEMQSRLKDMDALEKWLEKELAICEKKKQEYIEMYKKLSAEMEEMKQIASPGVAIDVKTGKIITVGLVQFKNHSSGAKDMKKLHLLIKGTQSAAKHYMTCMAHQSGHTEQFSQFQQSVAVDSIGGSETSLKQTPQGVRVRTPGKNKKGKGKKGKQCALRADTYNDQQIPANCRSDNFPVGQKFCVAGTTYTVLKSWNSGGGSSVNHKRNPGRGTIPKGTKITFGSCKEPETSGPDPTPKPEVKCALRADTYNDKQIPANCRSDNFPVGSEFCVAGTTYTVLKSWNSGGGSSVNHKRNPGRGTIPKGTKITFGSCKEPETGGPDPTPKPEVKCALRADTYNDQQIPANCRSDNFPVGSEFCVAGTTYTVLKSWNSGGGSSVNHKRNPGRGTIPKGTKITFGSCKEPETGGPDPTPVPVPPVEKNVDPFDDLQGPGEPDDPLDDDDPSLLPDDAVEEDEESDEDLVEDNDNELEEDEKPDIGDLLDEAGAQGGEGKEFQSGSANNEDFDGANMSIDSLRDEDDQAAMDAAGAIKSSAASPEKCKEEKTNLEETYVKTYVELSRLKDEYNELAKSTACFDNADSLYKSKKAPIQQKIDGLIKDIDDKTRALQGLRPRLDSATKAEAGLRKHIQTLTEECTQLPETISNLDKVRDAIEALSKCPGLSRVQFSLPKWIGTWVPFQLEAKSMTDGKQDEAMDAACAAAAKGTRAAEVGEIAEQTVEGIPETNTAGLPLIGTCPHCQGDEAADFPSSHKRVCWKQGVYLTPEAKSTNCASGKKNLLCVT